MIHIYELLADPTRRRIVDVLSTGEHAAGNLIAIARAEFGVSSSAVTHHLRVLRDAHAVKVEIDANQRLYSLRPEFVAQLCSELSRTIEMWDQRYGSRINRGPRVGPVLDSARNLIADVYEIDPAEDADSDRDAGFDGDGGGGGGGGGGGEEIIVGEEVGNAEGDAQQALRRRHRIAPRMPRARHRMDDVWRAPRLPD